ncbi:hypothetical protein BCR37DRAFT_348389 [Protomyces lactucae-debilis]|uniref:Flavin reductase like domain-containing protein n=1 Tax=Protomyces lactucae-debilis TaxID=2754530 RepID=A0A1Y2FCB5_PROLT|nr:uncharacterized protein BCR37DRAFT_348389 [Protomyces lactucae-debilis]ORY80956.1 hypothetical protein BCR37DRAFT_348389 [Protomyces lactucae-debilis]
MTTQGNAASAEAEKLIQRNPHGDFKKVEAGRDAYPARPWQQFQTPQPDWQPGGGANTLAGDWKTKKIIDIDPYEEGRPAAFNYKMLISAITPRPIGFLSTCSHDGSKRNLSPFSYFQMVNHDPPIFAVGFAGSIERAKDSLRNIIETKEAVINTISDHFIEAANFTSINAPYEVSEWALSGLTPLASHKVTPPRVHESIFTIECKLVEHREWKNPQDKVTGVTIFLEGVLFHAREDAINQERNLLDPAVLRSVSRLGGITYATCVDGYELPRPDFDKEQAEGRLEGLIREK